MKYLKKSLLIVPLFAVTALTSGCETEAEEEAAATAVGEVLAPAPTAYVPRGPRGGGGGGGWTGG